MKLKIFTAKTPTGIERQFNEFSLSNPTAVLTNVLPLQVTPISSNMIEYTLTIVYEG